MDKDRLGAFTDGVVAIIITIMVLELHVPEGSDWASLKPGLPVFFAYVLAYVNVGLYWANHHHLMHAVERVDGRVLWANLLLLFWLSLVPFVIRWMDETGFTSLPTLAYGVVLGLAAVSYAVLTRMVIAANGETSLLREAIGRDRKGKLSILLYALAIPLALIRPWLAIAIYVLVSAMWLIPDQRIERRVQE